MPLDADTSPLCACKQTADMRPGLVVGVLLLLSCLVAAGPVKGKASKKRSSLDDIALDDEDKVEQYEPVMQCKTCEDIVARVVNGARTTPMGVAPRGGARASFDQSKATIAVRAVEIVEEHGCKITDEKQKQTMIPAMCRATREALEDALVMLAKVPANMLTEEFEQKQTRGLCAPYCAMRTELEDQVAKMRKEMDSVRFQHSWGTVLWELAGIWYLWVPLFGSLGAMLIGTQLYVNKQRALLDEQRQRLSLLRKSS